MNKIEVKNLRYDLFEDLPWQIKVDRSSPLGNPFVMNEISDEERNFVCEKYEVWFIKQLTTNRNDPTYNRPFNVELGRLERIYEKLGRLELFCWCAPKRCHVQTIKRYLESVCSR